QRADDGYHQSRSALGGQIHAGRSGGDHSHEPRHRRKEWSTVPAPFLPRRSLPEEHRKASIRRLMMKRVVLALALLAPAVSLAIAFLARGVRAVGDKLQGQRAEVGLRFAQPLEPAFSPVRVLDAGGKQVDRKDKGLAPTDTWVLRVSLPPLAPG